MWLIFLEKQPVIAINSLEPSVYNLNSMVNRGNYCAMGYHEDIARFQQTRKCRALTYVERGQEHNDGAKSTMRTKKTEFSSRATRGTLLGC